MSDLQEKKQELGATVAAWLSAFVASVFHCAVLLMSAIVMIGTGFLSPSSELMAYEPITFSLLWPGALVFPLGVALATYRLFASDAQRRVGGIGGDVLMVAGAASLGLVLGFFVSAFSHSGDALTIDALGLGAAFLGASLAVLMLLTSRMRQRREPGAGSDVEVHE